MDSRPVGRASRFILYGGIAFVVALLLLSAGFVGGAVADRSGVLPGATAKEPDSIQSTFSVFWEAWDLVQKHYVDRSAIDPKIQTYGAIEGMLDSLGDVGHTRFLSPDALRSEEEALSGQFEGIGAHMVLRDGKPTVLAPIPGSPAQQAGLRPGDVIEAVDGKDVIGQRLDDVVKLVRGPAGTSVTLKVLHADQTTPVDITVVRAQINVPSVMWAMLPGTNVTHVLVSQFAERATTELVDALQAAQQQGAKAVILDLRNDPGGLRDEAVGVASQFLKDGLVLIEVSADGQRQEFPVKPGGVAQAIPLAILVNDGTASSAEIVAGALQDHKRGPVIGTTTLGTGTVLSIYKLSDGSAIFLGTEGWLTPNGRRIWHQGITPDITVALPAGAVPLIPAQAGAMSPEQLQSSNDAQLLRALQELNAAVPAH
ncbi:MAG: S41 family peptidase [Chloroflexi bacterium]|nr:S41 family peptidase [Chloroflexota bacterium]